MGRAPCCDKANVKRGPWSSEEDSKLKSYIELHGTGGNWIALPQKIGLKRCGKSCRLRWLNYLRPNIKHGGFSEEEDNIICSLYISIGSRWSIIAAQLPGRTDNDIKNYWNTRLKKKLLDKHRKEHQVMARKQQQVINNNLANLPLRFDSQNPYYWPELPVIGGLPNQEVVEPSFNDHVSIRKLLIKLGGKFHSDLHQQENGVVQLENQDGYSFDNIVNTQIPVEDQFPNSIGNNVAINNNNHISSNDGLDMFEGGGQEYSRPDSMSNSNEEVIKNMVYNFDDAEKIDGFEFLYNDEEIMSMMNERASISGTISTNSSYGADHQSGSSIGWSGSQEQMGQLVYDPTSLAAFGSPEIQRLLMPQEQCPNFCGGLSSFSVQQGRHDDMC